ncbi:MAG TPA: CCA tRNA nucleotidyltransferase [Alphaproteobacteria bacterium]|nr:CCA tRNA nucleotidyltransferase [Alphaproteobacteria bacterium]USO06609.1 MAG: CCA tRNA nucleotidyltransferase [Rhodospirillales bacterium]HOO80967.1 CCA tRNA nucleotidyltransferase [Alphaproteobacteria bacterium]
MDQKPVSMLEPQDWMKADETQSVMKALGQGYALFVGGCVRNALLGQSVDDIDIASALTPDEVTKKLEAAGIKVIPTGIDHGTVTAVTGGKPFEITTLRKDVETDGRRAVVEFSTDWAEDARRRDFTMNTLLMDLEGNIYDPLGCGLKDLHARRVVFVGDPRKRIAEDYLRILRYFRFHALYADGAPDAQALAACRTAADKIAALSKERITQEFFKILSVDDPLTVLILMFENDILKEFKTPEYDERLLKSLCYFQKNYGLVSIAARLLILAGFAEKNLKAFDDFLLIPKVFKKDIENLNQVLALPDLKDDHAVKVAIYKHGRTATAQGLMIELALDRVMNGYAPQAVKIIQNWDIPDFLLTGEDLIKEGFKPGPQLGEELQRREDAWIKGGFKN